MLHIETIEPGTFSLLKELMELPFLQSFSLVGGTALSLRYEHRSSVDLDLFFHDKFNQSGIIANLENVFKERFNYTQQQTKFGIFCFIENIKVDIVYFPHFPIAPIEIENKIRLYSSADIAAMLLHISLTLKKVKLRLVLKI